MSLLIRTYCRLHSLVLFPFFYLFLFFIKQRRCHNRQERIAAIVLSWKRSVNIPLVVAGLRKQSYIDDIIIFHNHPSKLKIPGCMNIFSNTNRGCVVRHKIAATLNHYDFFVFCDDDIMLSSDAAPEVLPSIRTHGDESMLGFFGQSLNLEYNDHSYTSGQPLKSSHRIMPVDIVKGRFHIISKKGVRAISTSGLDTTALLSEDDIRANVALQKQFKKPSFLIPLKHKIVELGNWHAIEQRKDHYECRDQAIRDALKLGWSLPMK